MKNRLFLLCTLCALILPAFASLHASNELNLQARLIWGTDQEKPKDPKLKELDSALKDRLKGVFKWKNYFEVNLQKFAVTPEAPKTVVMSDKCKIEVQNLGEALIEVKLFGEGKMVVKKRQPIKPGQPFVLAGDGKNDTAWFVVITASH
jgi:hypothetical protein